jgi:MSHA biogenesis protein MshJ
MKAQWQAMAAKVDALSVRERVFVFAGLVGVVTYLLYFGMLNPLYDKQKALRTKINHAQDNIDGFETDMAQRAAAFSADPDAANRIRLKIATEEAEALGTTLRNMQKALVAPDRIVPVIESILRNSKRLRLVSLKKLPVVGFSEPVPGSTPHGPVRLDAPAGRGTSERVVMQSTKAEMAAAAANAGTLAPGTAATAADLKLPGGVALPGMPAAASAPAAAAPQSLIAAPGAPVVAPPKPPELLFRHGVEITLSGSYLDMIAYMEALEALPTQLFWGKADFEVSQYPNARLTLTLYTLSMDKKWMKL